MLGMCLVLFFLERFYHVHKSLVCFPILLAKTRDGAAKIRAVELRVGGNLARQEAFAERAEGNESDPEFLECRQNLLFRLPPEQGVLALQGRHRLNRMSAADGFHTCFGQAEVPYLALLD